MSRETLSNSRSNCEGMIALDNFDVKDVALVEYTEITRLIPALLAASYREEPRAADPCGG